MEKFICACTRALNLFIITARVKLWLFRGHFSLATGGFAGNAGKVNEELVKSRGVDFDCFHILCRHTEVVSCAWVQHVIVKLLRLLGASEKQI